MFYIYTWEIEVAREFRVDPGLIRYLYGVAKHNYICLPDRHSIYIDDGKLTEHSKKIVKFAEEVIERNKYDMHMFYTWEIEVAREFRVDPGLIRYLYAVVKHDLYLSHNYNSIYIEGGKLTEYSKKIVKSAKEAIERNRYVLSL